MSRFEPYIVIHSLGGPVQGDDKTAYADFLNFLLQQREQEVSFFCGKFRDDAVNALAMSFTQEEKGDFFGNTYCYVGLTFPNLSVQFAGLWLGTWTKEQTRSVRMNIFGTDGIASKDFDALSEHLTNLALAVHRKLGAMATVIESSERALAPYNTKTMPLWAGWYAVYGETVQKKYGLAKTAEFPEGISSTKAGADLVVRHSVPFSQHILKGWSPEQYTFWQGVGGKLLRKPGKYKLPPKDGETYIVDAVDEKSGAMLLKPYSDS